MGFGAMGDPDNDEGGDVPRRREEIMADIYQIRAPIS